MISYIINANINVNEAVSFKTVYQMIKDMSAIQIIKIDFLGV